MTKNTRFLILIICLILFFSITPVLVFYSLGYKFDPKNFKIVATGGIYIRAEQFGTEVIIDSKINKKTSFFSNSVFMQNLTAGNHDILIKKDDYFWYIKKINVKENEVTKIENITLFKNNITWYNLDKTLSKTIFLKNDDIQSNLILTKAVSYAINDNNIIWLGSDGNLNKSDIDGKNTEIITSSPVLIDKNNSYKIFANDFGIFVLKNKDLLLFNAKTGAINFFMANINDLKTSPDGQNIFYITDSEIWLNHSNYEYSQDQDQINASAKILLNKFYEKISDVFWINNNYLILKADNKIKISEIDNRGNININDLPLPANFTLNSKSQIHFDQQDKKLYILSEENFISSERLLP